MRPKNFPAAPSSDGDSLQDEQDVPVSGRKGSTRMYSNREKKLANLPKFERKNERGSANSLDENGRSNKGLWKDPEPDIESNRAKAQVYGSGEELHEGAGARANESNHADAPSFRHFELESEEIQEHQDRIIDKHAPTEEVFSHGSRSKPSYALSERAKSTRGKKN
jgi:hypothetical protein